MVSIFSNYPISFKDEYFENNRIIILVMYLKTLFEYILNYNQEVGNFGIKRIAR